MWKTTKFYALSLLIIGLAGTAVYYKYFPARAGVSRTVDLPAVVKQIQQLNELVTVKYSLEKVIGLTEQKVPFGTEKVMILVQAKVKAGVDLGHVEASADTAGITLHLPPAVITDIYIDDQQTKVWDRSLSWWAVWVSPNPDLEQSARRAALESVRVAAEQMGILSNAQANAELGLRQFLNSVGVSNVNIVATK